MPEQEQVVSNQPDNQESPPAPRGSALFARMRDRRKKAAAEAVPQDTNDSSPVSGGVSIDDIPSITQLPTDPVAPEESESDVEVDDDQTDEPQSEPAGQ